MGTTTDKRFTEFDAEGETDCSACGIRQRLAKHEDGAAASISRLKIQGARPHYHKNTEEFYYILEGEGTLIVDGEEVPVAPGDCVWLQKGAVHHAVGDHLVTLVIAVPAYDGTDTYYPENADA